MNVTTQTEAGARAIIAGVIGKLRDFRGVWQDLRTVLPDIQKDWWDRRFGSSRALHTTATVRARRNRRGYYRNPPNDRADADSPYLEWTGSLREATEQITEARMTEARIDTVRNYRGSIRLRDPHFALMQQRGFEVWDLRTIDRRLDADILERHAVRSIRRGVL